MTGTLEWKREINVFVVHTGDGQLALTLQESSICVDELVRLNSKTPSN